MEGAEVKPCPFLLVTWQQIKSGNSTGDPAETHGDDFEEADNLQSVLYVLVVCAIILAAIVVAHLLLIVLYSRFSSSPLAPSLLFPRFEVSSIWQADAIGTQTLYTCVYGACSNIRQREPSLERVSVVPKLPQGAETNKQHACMLHQKKSHRPRKGKKSCRLRKLLTPIEENRRYFGCA
eukprot:1150748-Pelagomonas_calceolata.AAC.4